VTAALDTRARRLTPLQAGILFHSRLEPGAGIYIQQLVVHWSERADSAALQSAWRLLVERHSILRTSFQLDGDTATQIEHEHVEMPFVELDWGAGPGVFKISFANKRHVRRIVSPSSSTIVRSVMPRWTVRQINSPTACARSAWGRT
jgi:hypothetical protein